MDRIRTPITLAVLFGLFLVSVASAQPPLVGPRAWTVKELDPTKMHDGWETDYYFRSNVRVYWITVGKSKGGLTKFAINVTDIPRQQFSHLYAENGLVRSTHGPAYLLIEFGSEGVVCSLPIHVQRMLVAIGIARECPSA